MVSYLDKILLKLHIFNKRIVEKEARELREIENNLNLIGEDIKVLDQQVDELDAKFHAYIAQSNARMAMKSVSQSSSEKHCVINSGFHNLYLTEMKYQKETNSKLDENGLYDKVSGLIKEPNIKDKILLDDKVAYVLRKKYN